MSTHISRSRPAPHCFALWLVLLALLWLLPASLALADSDNFNDNSRNTTRWGTSDFGQPGGLVEANQRLEYRNATTSELYTVWAWQTLLPFGQDWQARVNVNVPALSFSADGYAGLSLYVRNGADASDIVGLEFEAGRDLGSAYRQFVSLVHVNGVDMPGLDLYVPTASTSATFRARWVAATARLHLEYDADGPANGEVWTTLRTFDPAATWGMTSGNFQVGIGGFSGNRVIASSSGVSLDDFSGVVGTPPSIFAQPQSQTLSAGSNATFSVTATGSMPFAYQWVKDGMNVPGATNATLTFTNVARSNSGNYSVTVTNIGGSITSGYALLRVPVPQRVLPLTSLGGGRYRISFSDLDGGLLFPWDLDYLEIENCTDLMAGEWTPMGNPIVITNGIGRSEFLAPNTPPQQFYRIRMQ